MPTSRQYAPGVSLLVPGIFAATPKGQKSRRSDAHAVIHIQVVEFHAPSGSSILFCAAPMSDDALNTTFSPHTRQPRGHRNRFALAPNATLTIDQETARLLPGLMPTMFLSCPIYIKNTSAKLRAFISRLRRSASRRLEEITPIKKRDARTR